MNLLRTASHVSNYYIHIPFCIQKCHYCSFPIHAIGKNVNQANSFMNQYMDKLIKEIQICKSQQSMSQPIQSIYIGGGTPSLVDPSQISRLLTLFSDGITKQTEITMEMNMQESKKIEQFLQSGINRLSIGIQTLNQTTLSEFNRQFTQMQQYLLRIQQARNKNNINLNLDFIIDFNSKAEEQSSMLKTISDISPNHLSLYILEVNQGSYLHQNQFKFKDKFGNFASFVQLSQILTQSSYQHYEVSNFCKAGYESKHNKMYWEGNKPFAAYGMGATSFLNKKRITRPSSVGKYLQFMNKVEQGSSEVEKYLQIHDESGKEEQLKWVILSRLRRKQGISWKQLESSLNEQQLQKIKAVLQEIHQQNKNLLNYEQINERISVRVPQGYLYVDLIGYRILDSLFN